MEIVELLSVARQITEKIKATGFDNLAKQITQQLQKIEQPGQITPQIRAQIYTTVEGAKNQLLSSISQVLPPSLSLEQSKVYDILGAYNLFGFDGQERLRTIFTELQSNPNIVKDNFQSYLQEVNKILILNSSLASFADKIPYSSHSKNKDEIIIFFQAGAEINNLDELAKVSNKWNQVLIGLAMLAKENDTTFRIETVERGSIILTLSTAVGVTIAFAKVAEKSLDIIKKYYEIKKLAHEAKALKGIPEKAVQELENSSKLKLKTESIEIARQLLEEYDWSNIENRKDVDTAVRFAVRYILEFLNKGGKVDVKLLAEGSEKEIELSLSLKYNEIKKIENLIKPDGEHKQLLELTDNDPEQ